MQKDIMHAENVTILVERDFRIVDLSTLMCSGDKIFSAVFDPFDGSTQFHRGPRDENLFLIEHHDLRTESAADERRDHAHLPLGEPEHARESVSGHYGSLRGIPDG